MSLITYTVTQRVFWIEDAKKSSNYIYMNQFWWGGFDDTKYPPPFSDT